jgi:Phasin protein
MTQFESRETRTAADLAGDFFGFGTNRMESLLEMQKHLVESFEQFNRAQMERAKRETELASEFAGKVTSARSVPDVMSAYQEWLSRRMAMFAEDGQKLFSESQKAVNETMRLLTNGRNGSST